MNSSTLPATDPASIAAARLDLRVYYEDTDAAGVVYYANYLRYLERGRSEWLREAGVDQAPLAAEHGVAFAVRALSIDYLRPARLDDLIRVETLVTRLSRAQVWFAQRILRGEDELVRAEVQVACIDARQLKPAGIPAWLRQRMESTT